MDGHRVGDLIGKTLTSVENVDDEAIVFTTAEGERFKLHHIQDCCESVTVEDVIGDLDDLVGAPILMAEEATNSDEPPPRPSPWPEEHGYGPESYTWTFYKFATVKGYVTIRFFGQSNGYYSEAVDFEKCKTT